jgi:acyl dehydratase
MTGSQPQIPARVEAGFELPSLKVPFTRSTLVRYAGASTDFNPIHYSDTAATNLGLDGVIAHGMLTMGTALRVVTDWVGDPARVLGYQVRFTRPVRVPDTTDGVVVEFSATVKKIVEGVATIGIDAVCGDDKVLGAALAEVRLD